MNDEETGRPDEARVRSQALDRSFVQGIAWMTGMRWAGQMVSWAATIIVARILSPEDYGIVAMASVFLGAVTLLSEFGLGTTIVMLRDLEPHQVKQLNSASVLLGVAALLVSCAAAIPLSLFFRAPALPPVVIVMSLYFIIMSFRNIPQALLQRDLRFRRLAVLDAGQALAVAAIMVLLAMLHFRYWTLVIGNLLGAVFSTALILSVRRCGFAWPRAHSIGGAITFSWRVLVARMAWYVYSTADFLVAGRRLGKEALGAYNVAWSLASIPVEKISALIFSVTPAYFSAVQRDPSALRRYLLQLTEATALITVPATFGLAVVAPDFVPVVLGEKWTSMIVPLQILGAYASIRSITPLLPQILGVVGDVRFSMWNSILAAVVLPTAFWVGSRWGIVGLAAAWAIVHPLVIVPLYLRVARRVDLRFSVYVRTLWPSISSTALMVFAMAAFRIFIAGSWQGTPRLIASIAVGVAVFLASIFVLHRARVRSAIAGIRRMRRSPGPVDSGESPPEAR